MTAPELAELLDAIANRARSLRDAGVRDITIGNVRLTLDAPVQAFSADKTSSATPQPRSTALDPATYGLPPGSKVPGIDWGPGNEMTDASDRRDRELGRPVPKGRMRE